MKRKPPVSLLAGVVSLLLWAGLVAWVSGLPVSAEEPAGEVAEAGEVTIGESAQLELVVGGKVLPLEVRRTSLPEEAMVRADHQALGVVAKAFGKGLEWSPNTNTLVCTRGGESRTLRLGQTRFPDEEGGRNLDAPPQMIDGAVHVPLSILEDFLDVRLTLKDKRIFVEPVIRSVRLEGDPRAPKLVVQASAPVTYKAFKLKQPGRYVIDIKGAVLDAPGQTIHHPRMGSVRMGQFELGPAISRIVVPTHTGVEVEGATQGAGQEFAFQLALPEVAAPGQNFGLQKITSVTLEKMTKGQRLLLEASGPIQYEWHRLDAPDNRFFLDIPQAVLVGPKQEMELDDPYLGVVRVSQFQSEPTPVVRVVMGLKSPADTRLLDGDTDSSMAVEVHHQDIDPKVAVLRGYGTTAFPAPGGVICIDPGHGGGDPGAVNRGLGITEKEVTLDISRRLAMILKKQGWNVVMTRNDDRDVSWNGSSARQELGARVKVANDLQADLLVSIHCNASTNPGSNGTSLHYFKRGDEVLAREMQGAVLAGTGRANRGLQKNRFYVLAHSQMPSVLVETAFLTNQKEGTLLNDPNYRQKVAESIAQGLRLYASNHLNWAAAGR